MSKRIKKVFSSSYEVFHLWANQTQSEARQGGRVTRAFFDGTSCYSYGRHYRLGELVRIKGKAVALINRTGYSHTTSKHISEASSAASHLLQIDVDGTFDWRAGLKKTQAKLNSDLASILRQRVFWKGYKITAPDNYIQEQIKEHNKVCSALGQSKLKVTPSKAYLKQLQAHIDYRVKREAELKALRGTPEYLAKQEKARIQKELKQQEKSLAEIESWKKGGPFTEAVKRAVPQLIRVKDNVVETSRHAHVGIDVAREALRALLRGKLEQGARIGQFEFGGIDADCIRVGCHTLSLKEVKETLLTNTTLRLVASK